REAKFSTWLYRIATNHCLSRIKRLPPGTHCSLDEETGALVPPRNLTTVQSQEGKVLRREQREQVLQALGRLSSKQRLVVELKIYEEQKFEEISDILDVPLSTVKSRFYTALERLKAPLGELSRGH
ncbi:MAG: RNA polymerase sigma factor, partial [Acidobacteriota bacterium]